MYALTAGRVVISCEKYEPQMANYWAAKTYSDRQGQMANTYKKYFNVIADPLEPRFKMVDQV